jgi:hypothetical protein
MDNNIGSFRRNGDSSHRETVAGDAERACNYGKPYFKPSGIGFLRNERGTIIDFLITCLAICFFCFAGVEYFTPIAQNQIAENISHYYLERARVEGYLTAQDGTDLTNKFASAQMTVESISVTNQGIPITAPLERDPDNPDASEIDISIQYEPDQQPFTIGELIGVPAPSSSTYKPKVGGSVLSEYVSSS